MRRRGVALLLDPLDRVDVVPPVGSLARQRRDGADLGEQVPGWWRRGQARRRAGRSPGPGRAAQLAARSGVMRNTEVGAKLAGNPAIPAKEFFRQMAVLAKLTKERNRKD